MHGQGRMLGGRGEVYEGEFSNGMRDGKGECACCRGPRSTPVQPPHPYPPPSHPRPPPSDPRAVRLLRQLHIPASRCSPVHPPARLAPPPLRCVYCDGGVYRGQWAAGLCEGHGRLQQADAYHSPILFTTCVRTY